MNNRIYICGDIVGDLVYSHEALNERFYMFYVRTRRLSGFADVIPVIAPERTIGDLHDYNGLFVNIYGHIRSRNTKGKVLVFVFAKGISFKNTADERDSDMAFLDGYICKAPIYRKTPLGSEITDLFIAVNRPCRKTDYIPCICWGRTARFAEKLTVGDCVSVCGRIQSRDYVKKFEDGNFETRTAYEVSVIRISEMESEEDASESRHEENL